MCLFLIGKKDPLTASLREKGQQPGISGLKAAWVTAQHSSANELVLRKSSVSPAGDQREGERAADQVSSESTSRAGWGTERRRLERKQQQVSRGEAVYSWIHCVWTHAYTNICRDLSPSVSQLHAARRHHEHQHEEGLPFSTAGVRREEEKRKEDR